MENALKRKQRREEHKKLGLCVQCSTKAILNTTRCEKHTLLHREQDTALRTLRKSIGVCIECTDKALPNNCRCEFHRVHHLKRLKITKPALVKEWKLANRCIRCGNNLNPEMDGTCVKCLNCRLEAHLPFKRSDFKF